MKAKNDGKGFEQIIATTCDAYERGGVLRMQKAEPPTKRIKEGPHWKILEMANPFLDYAGTWTERGGRALFVECKSTTGEGSLRIDQDGGVTTKQVTALRRWHNAGAAVAVLWEVDRKHCFALSHDMLVAVLNSGRKSVRFEELPRVTPGTGFVLYDFAVLLRTFYPLA